MPGAEVISFPPIVVYGTPAPQGSKRIARAGGKITGRPILIEDNNEAKNSWRDAVSVAARMIIRHGGMDLPVFPGPLAVSMVLTRKRPSGLPKRKRIGGDLIEVTHYPNTRPDVDKLSRAVLDALKDAGVYADDGQVVVLLAAKSYPREWPDSLEIPGAVIRVRPVESFMADLFLAFAINEDVPLPSPVDLL